MSKPHENWDIFCGYAPLHDTLRITASIESPSSSNLPSNFPVLAVPYPFHSLFLTSQDDLWPTTNLGQAPTVVRKCPSTMTLTLAPQIDVNMCEWRCPNCNMGQYSWSHRDAVAAKL